MSADLYGRSEAELRESTRRIRAERERLQGWPDMDAPVRRRTEPITCGACGIAVDADHRLCPWCQTPVAR
jgi:hypothetical protein